MTFDDWRALYQADPVRFHELSKARRSSLFRATTDLEYMVADHWTSIDQDERARVCTRRHGGTGKGWSEQPCYQLHLGAARAWAELLA